MPQSGGGTAPDRTAAQSAAQGETCRCLVDAGLAGEHSTA